MFTPSSACASKPSPSGFVIPITCSTPSSTNRPYRALTVASPTPSFAAIARNDSRPFAWSISMMPRSTVSSDRGRLTGPRPWAGAGGTHGLYKIAAQSVNFGAP